MRDPGHRCATVDEHRLFFAMWALVADQVNASTGAPAGQDPVLFTLEQLLRRGAIDGFVGGDAKGQRGGEEDEHKGEGGGQGGEGDACARF